MDRVETEVVMFEHHSSMGTAVSYKHENAKHPSCYGLDLGGLFPELELGEGARFKVTVELIEPGVQTENPWARPKRGADDHG